MTTGTVKAYDHQKGFGFITPDDGGPAVFVHKTALISAGLVTLQGSQTVEFQIVSGKGGKPAATNLKLL
jgi:cold shock protein